MAGSWNYDRAAEHIEQKIEEVEKITVLEYKREMSLENIPASKAYKVDGVHLYADILNIGAMLNVTEAEGELCHKRTLRFLNLHQRAVHRVLARCDARRVDFHNQRLHGLVTKPYNTEVGAEADRVRRAVAIAQLIIDVLAETGDDDEHIPSAEVRVGIDTGETLAVNNGRRGGREPLFLGDAANHAARLAGGGTATGIFLSNSAREAIGLPKASSAASTRLTRGQIEDCEEEADLGVSKDTIIREWREDLKANPIGAFAFTRHKPPLRTMDVPALTPANSRRQEAVSVYGDIDGFTAFVRNNIELNAQDVVRVFHVIRAELDRVLTCDFGGRRIRFIGDCIHGLLCEGTAHTTYAGETVSTATMCAGALRSSFNLTLEKLEEEGMDVEGLGLAIGFEFGPMSVTRLGMRGDRVRCCVSRGVLAGEEEQKRCTGTETAIGSAAYEEGSDAVQELFGASRKIRNLDYNEAVEALSSKGDETAKIEKKSAYEAYAPAIVRSAATPITPYAGFAESK